MTYSPNFRGGYPKVGARAISTAYFNATGDEVVQCTPLSINTSGQLIELDVTDPDVVNRMVGLADADIPLAATGGVTKAGRIEDVVIGFTIGTALYVSKAGFLTSTKPELGVDGFVAGDHVIFVGLVVKNEFDSLKKDLDVFPTVVGRL